MNRRGLSLIGMVWFDSHHSNMDNEIYLGEKVKDKVTGLVGIVVARCVYLNNCVQFLVQPKVIDHRIVEGYWIDESQLEIINSPKPKEEVKPRVYPDLAKKHRERGGGVRAHPRGQ